MGREIELILSRNKYFSERITPVNNIKGNEFDILSSRSCSTYQKEKIFCDSCYNNAFFELMEGLGYPKRQPFIEHHIHIRKDSQKFLNELNGFLYDCQDGFEYKVYSHYKEIIENKLQPQQEVPSETTVIYEKVIYKADDFWNLIHPQIAKVSKSLFESGHFAESVSASFKHLIEVIKAEYKKTKPKEILDGKPLMMKAFDQDNPVFQLEAKSEDTYIDVQEGYKFLYAGATMAIRNTKSHKNLTIDETNAIEKLFLASMLLKRFENKI